MAIEITEVQKNKFIIKCNEKCFFAKEKRCRCKCGGLYHGKGLGIKQGVTDKIEQQEELF